MPTDSAPKPKQSRRNWMKAGGVSAVGGVFLGAYFWRSLAEEVEEFREFRQRPGPYGPLRRDPLGMLDLPEGFTYTVIDRVGTRMSDGYTTPARFDGMACFEGPEPGTWALLRNHENPSGMSSFGPSPDRPIPEAFDPGKPGGVTRVVVDARTLAKRSSNLVLAGTVVNCAGGTSPWGWLSCEESVDPGHGYVFVCDPSLDRVAPARPIRAFGRFRHEAACVDPETGIVYLSEDRDDSCLYRFVPHDPARPFEGTLQAMRVRGMPQLDSGKRLATTDRVEIDWVPLHDPDPEEDVLRSQAQAQGAAILRRGEGLAFTREGERPVVLISATAGGQNELGQILRLDPEGGGGELSVIAESTGQYDFDMPDNLVMSPYGHIYFCEDGYARNYVRGIEPSGRIFDFARNALSRSELVGVCFSPDATTMFVSLQVDGILLGIRGPFAVG